MGIELWSLQFLIEARTRFGPFGDLLQIGRQELHIHEQDFGRADVYLQRADFSQSYKEATGGSRWADEGLFQLLGAKTISSADASSYEGADLVHDFNDPIDIAWHQRFDTLFDGGSLEHIFNIPVAVANEMNLLRVGGRLLSAIPANNWLGHGFYQFSPEFAYRVFAPEKGFRVECAFFTEMRADHEFYEIEDLARRAGGEIGTTNTNTNMDFVALKMHHVRPFRRWPQQGDYKRAWDQAADENPGESNHPVVATRKLSSRIARLLRADSARQMPDESASGRSGGRNA